MTSLFPTIFSFKNLGQCIYIGNTSLVDATALLNYCARFGTIASSLSIKEKFRDFNIIEYTTSEQCERFLNYQRHQINNIQLDVRLYKHILLNNEILHIDRKFFIGPILNSRDEETIVKFYRSIDSSLQYCRSKEDKDVYLLFEFNSRQSIARIFEKENKPLSPNDNYKYSIFKPLHPKQFVYRLISLNNKQNQILISGLTKYITQNILIDYFDKRAPVLGCIILPNNSSCAIMEFSDRKIVKKILSISQICINNVNLTLKEVANSLASILNPNEANSQSDDEEQTTIKPTPIEYPVNSLPILTNQQSNLVVNFTPFIPVTHPINTPSSSVENDHSGWSSPPRSAINHSLSIDQPSVLTSSSSKPCATTNSTPSYFQTTMEVDIKPNIIHCSTNNIMQFYEQIKNELEQIRNEYRSKFDNDQRYIDQEIRILLNEERHTFDKLERYISDQRKQTQKRNKRKSSPSTTRK